VGMDEPISIPTESLRNIGFDESLLMTGCSLAGNIAISISVEETVGALEPLCFTDTNRVVPGKTLVVSGSFKAVVVVTVVLTVSVFDVCSNVVSVLEVISSVVLNVDVFVVVEIVDVCSDVVELA
jgi:hypothetical protein